MTKETPEAARKEIILYNSLSRTREPLVTLKKGAIGMYVCGITAYDEPHIGHARSAFVFDVIARFLRHEGLDVVYVRNITDVDDKIIARARKAEEERDTRFTGGDLRETCQRIAEFYTEIYTRYLDTLGFGLPTHEPKATESIDDMIVIIEALCAKGFAYVLDSGVYFEIGKFTRYGILSNRNPDEMRDSGEPFSKGKKSPLDFALWKTAKPEEPSWKSPWGQGRPGWHIECSAMSRRYLGIPFDVHGGGLDLIFPHHENELAQSYCYAGENPIRYWIHNGLLTIEGRKMSKSLGNFITIKDALEVTSPEVLKLSFVSTHYAHPFNFSLDKLKQSQAAYEKITALLEKTAQLKPAQGVVALPDEMRHTAMRYNEEFFSCMRDDFNTPSAVAALFDLVNYAQKIFLDDSVGAAVKSAFLKDTFTPLLTRLGAVIGIRFQGAATQESRALTEGLRAAHDTFSKDAALQEVFSALGVRAAGDPYNVIHAVIDARNRARAQKDFTRADALRAFLREAGVALEDTKDTTFFKITHHG